MDYGHAEVQQLFGADPRRYETLTKRFITDDANNLTGLETVRVEWTSKGGKWSMEEVPNSKEIIEADICLLALGFLGPSKYLLEQFGVQTDVRGNVKTAHGVSTFSLQEAFTNVNRATKLQCQASSQPGTAVVVRVSDGHGRMRLTL